MPAVQWYGPLSATLGFLPARKPDQHPAMIAAFGLVDEPEPGIVGKPHDVISGGYAGAPANLKLTFHLGPLSCRSSGGLEFVDGP
jgi:hypothetical protein